MNPLASLSSAVARSFDCHAAHQDKLACFNDRLPDGLQGRLDSTRSAAPAGAAAA